MLAAHSVTRRTSGGQAKDERQPAARFDLSWVRLRDHPGVRDDGDVRKLWITGLDGS